MLTIELAAMPAITYREHIDLFNKYKVAKIPYGKIFLSLAFTLILSLSASLFLTGSKNKQVSPVNEQLSYFQSVSTSYYKSKQSLDDLRSNLQVAGVKTEKVDQLREASATSRVPGFFTTIGDIQKVIDQIKLTRENIVSERQSIQGKDVPVIYKTLDAQVIEYQLQAEDFLTKTEKFQMSLKDLISAASPAFYLPVLSDDSVWQRGDIEEIKAYYGNRKSEAEQALAAFSKINSTDNLKVYKDLQESHILLVINLSENIMNVLSRPVSGEEESEQLKEEAYQVLVGAQRENQDLADRMASERSNLTSLSYYSQHLLSLSNRERIIESGIADGAVNAQSARTPSN